MSIPRNLQIKPKCTPEVWFSRPRTQSSPDTGRAQAGRTGLREKMSNFSGAEDVDKMVDGVLPSEASRNVVGAEELNSRERDVVVFN